VKPEPLEHRLLLASPGDPLFAVWGDELVDAGDPRGTLVALCRQLDQKPGDPVLLAATSASRAANADTWCPDCLDDTETLRLTWRDGFIDTVTFDGEPMSGDAGYGEEEEDAGGAGGALHRLITMPIAARISSLSLRCPIDAEGNHGCWGHHEAFVARLSKREWPWLTSLDFDGLTLPTPLKHGRAAPELSFLRFGEMHDAEITVGDLSALWKRAPRLEHLVLAQPTGVLLGQVNAPKLRTLVFGSADTEALTAIAEGRLPALETLLVRVSEPEDVAALVGSKSIGPLKHLGLIGTPSGEGEEGRGDELIRALLASDRCEQLESLDLGGIDATDEGWSQLIDAAPRFKRLETLRLTTWELDKTVSETDDWMEDSLEYYSGDHFSPRKRAIGNRLSQALPVRWLTASIVSVIENTGRKQGLFYGFFNSDGYAEDRG
jgi:hypothetical protein